MCCTRWSLLSARLADANAMDAMAALIDNGMLLQSARGPLPNVAELVAGEPIKGSWWAHPKSHEIFAALNQLSESPDVVRLRLVKGKVTLVHRRLWPALVRAADHFTVSQLAALHEDENSDVIGGSWILTLRVRIW